MKTMSFPVGVLKFSFVLCFGICFSLQAERGET